METNSQSKSYPVATAISCYKEGKLIRGAIRSVSMLSGDTWVWEGLNNPVAPSSVKGDLTDIGTEYFDKLHWNSDTWESEAAKRTGMIQDIKAWYPDGCWILSMDADEILVWGDYLQDWLDMLDPGYPHSDENIVPILMSELSPESVNGWICRQSNGRLIHSSCIDHYELTSVVFISPTGEKGFFNHSNSLRFPFPGEPHLHHREYLRKPDRAEFRQHDWERMELEELNLDLKSKREAGKLARSIRQRR